MSEAFLMQICALYP